MSDNPKSFEERVRERAYQLWLDVGQPEDRAAEIWHQAWEAELMRDQDQTIKGARKE